MARHIMAAWVGIFVVASVLGGQAQAQSASAVPQMSKAERARITAILRDVLVKDPSLLKDAIEAMQARELAASQAARAQGLKEFAADLARETDTPVGGNAKGDVTVVEFYDYLCGYCKRAAGELRALKQRDPQVRVVYKEFPVLGETSQALAKAALAAHRQGRFEAFHDALMAAEQPDAASARALATTLGLDMTRYDRDLADPALDANIARNQRQAAALDINGTPAFVIGSTLLPGAVGVDVLAQAVIAARVPRPQGAAR